MRLASLPRPATRADYDAAARELDDALDSLPGRIAVYGTGAVSAPGISDIDRVVVVDGPVPDVWQALSPRTRELAMHTPFAVDAGTFARHRELAHVEPLELLRGDGIVVRERPEPALLTLLLAAEGATVLLLQLAKTAVTQTAKVRPLLCQLHGLRHDLTLAGLTREAAPAAWQLADAVAELRLEWFSALDARARFSELLAGAPTAVGSALDAMTSLATGFVAGDPPTLAARDPWRRARIRAGTRTQAHTRSLPLLHGPRTGEVAWRLLGADVVLPGPVVALLAGSVDAPHRAAVARRSELAAAHALRRPPGYSALGFAGAFLP